MRPAQSMLLEPCRSSMDGHISLELKFLFLSESKSEFYFVHALFLSSLLPCCWRFSMLSDGCVVVDSICGRDDPLLAA